MTKKEIKQIIKKYGFTMINCSYFGGEYGVLFNAYNQQGTVAKFWVSHDLHYCDMQFLSEVAIYDANEITGWFI